MRTFSTTIDIQAPPALVWAVMSDVERWHEWTASITGVRRLDGGPFRIGSRARIKQPKFPPAFWEVTELDEGRSFAWVSRVPGISVTGRHIVEPQGNGSRVRLVLEFDGPLGPLFGSLTSGINRRYLALEANGLKHRSEGSRP